MNAIFSISRFTHLFKEHWVRIWKSMAVISMIVAGLLSIALVYFELQYDYRPLKYQEVQQNVFSLGFTLISIGFCLNFYYSNWYGSKKTAVLSLPVSGFERTLLSFIWMTLFFSLWYLSLFYLINIPISKWANSFEFQAHHHPSSRYGYLDYSPSNMLSLLNPYLLNSMYIFILIQTMVLAFLLWFKRHALVKSIAVVFLITLVYGWFHNYIIPTWLTPANWDYDDNTIRMMIDQVFTEFNEIQASAFWANLNRSQLLYVWLALWGVIYYRIKEQEA